MFAYRLFYQDWNKNERYHPYQNGNVVAQLLRMGNSIQHNWIKEYTCKYSTSEKSSYKDGKTCIESLNSKNIHWNVCDAQKAA